MNPSTHRSCFGGAALVFSLMVTACAPAKDDGGETESDSDGGDAGPRVIAAYPTLSAACAFRAEEPTRLAVTATDFATGSVGVADVAGLSIDKDLAMASTDAVLVPHGDRLYVVNRFMYDYVDVLAAADFSLLGEFAIETGREDVSANPYSMVFGVDGLAHVVLFGVPEIHVFDLSDPAAAELVRRIDVSAFADADGNPELGATLGCGDVAFAAAERLSPDYVPTDTTRLVPFSLAEAAVYDFDPANPGADAIALQGTGMHGFRGDPRDASGQVALVLTSGLERIDLRTGEVQWAIDQSVLADAGLMGMQLGGFDVGPDGDVWLVAANEDFSEYSLWHATLEAAGADLEQLAPRFQSVSGAMEVIGDQAWVADTTVGASGLRVFDLSADPVVDATEAPIGTGLPPYEIVGLP